MDLWQEDTIETLISILEPDVDVLALLLFGSCSTPESNRDCWSDIDALIVVEERAVASYYPTLEWLGPFGTIYTSDQSSDAFRHLTRVCFRDFRRMDIVVATESKFAEIDHWPRNPLYPEAKVLFSRSMIVDRALVLLTKRPDLSPFTPDQFQEMVRAFRFKSMLVIHKVVRDDLLVALHLALDLIRDCTVLGMALRDRAEGTSVHNTGGIGNQTVKQLDGIGRQFSALGILDTVEQSSIIFDRLSNEWSGDSHENCRPILSWIEEARKEINAQ